MYISRTELIECSVSLEPQFCYRDLRGVREYRQSVVGYIPRRRIIMIEGNIMVERYISISRSNDPISWASMCLVTAISPTFIEAS